MQNEPPLTPVKRGIGYLDGLLGRLSSFQAAALVAVLAACALIPVWNSFAVVSKDAVHKYIPLARLLQQEGYLRVFSSPLQPSFPLPLYEFFISLTMRLTGLPPDTSGRLVASFFFVLGAMGVFFCAEAIFKRRVISVAALLFTLSNRMLLGASVDCLKESLLVCMVIWGNYFFIRGMDQGGKAVHFIAGSVILIAGIMVRSTSLVFFFAWAAMWIFHKREGMIIRGAVVVFPVLLIVIPSLEYPSFPLYRMTLSTSYIIKIIKNVLAFDVVKIVWIADVFRFLLKRSHYAFALFAFWGLYHHRRHPYARHLAVSLVFLMITFLPRTRQTFADRYLLAVIIYMLPLSAAMVIHSLESCSSRLIRVAAFATLLFCPVLWGAEAFATPDPDKLARKEAGRFILSRVGPGWDIISNRQQVSYFADGNLVYVDVRPAENDYQRFTAHRISDFKNTTNRITLCDVVCQGKVLTPIAIDTHLREDLVWIGMLDCQGIRPDRIIRDIRIYLPAGEKKKP